MIITLTDYIRSLYFLEHTLTFSAHTNIGGVCSRANIATEYRVRFNTELFGPHSTLSTEHILENNYAFMLFNHRLCRSDATALMRFRLCMMWCTLDVISARTQKAFAQILICVSHEFLIIIMV